MMQITFHGAAREVTGSLHLIEVDSQRVALDCGLFQGRRRESDAKNRTFPFDAARLDAVILSHAHIDHSGRLPLLARQGFDGTVYSTAATRDLCAIMLADSAHIQEEDAKFLTKRLHKKRPGAEPPVDPLYESRDAADVLRLFHTVSLNRPFRVTSSLTAQFHEAGHMLGSAGVTLTYANGRQPPVTLVFSGDIGRFEMPILRNPAALPECDYLICESTYGGRKTQSNVDLKERLEAVIKETFERGGKVIIPAFSVGRTQTLVYFIHQLMEAGRLKDVPVYIDSPLSIDATEVFRLHPDCFDAEARRFNSRTGDMLGGGCCTYVRDVEDSKAINRRRRPCVVISASGMCENGRILHHLKNNVTSPKNTVLIVGFQGQHTLGRRIVEREKHLKILGEKLPLRAQVVVLNGFSAHADRDELRRLTQPLARRVKRAFLVHGEIDQMEKMTATMREDGFVDVSAPETGTTVPLNGGASSPG
ncbi:MAG: MBL fold metallo-hydrolase [Phycisphaerae bacterium]|nr:MBL fold metallo-hydrolase [Phycisphaerae bacterium]NUQ46942.1 MBL fold metallo-hydrolase [Phycisphaerae bacterium]